MSLPFMFKSCIYHWIWIEFFISSLQYSIVQSVFSIITFLFSRGDFPNPEIEPSLPHCRWIPYQLSHKGSPKILECVDYPFSRGSSQPRKQSTVLALQEDSLPTELWGKPSQSVRLGLISTDSFDFHSSEDVCISFHSWRIFL